MILEASFSGVKELVIALNAFSCDGTLATVRFEVRAESATAPVHGTGRHLQICVGESNSYSHLVPGQYSSETVNVFPHIPQLGPVSKTRTTAARPR